MKKEDLFTELFAERHCDDPRTWKGEIQYFLRERLSESRAEYDDLPSFRAVDRLSHEVSMWIGIQFPAQKLYRLVYELWQQEQYR
jgi:hypothetical protein